MNLEWTPFLANGLVMLDVLFAWLIALLAAVGMALAAIILAGVRRTRQTTRWLPLVSLVVSLGPAAVLAWYHEPVASYAMRDLPVMLSLSLLPIVMSALALWLSRRALQENEPQDEEVCNEHK